MTGLWLMLAGLVLLWLATRLLKKSTMALIHTGYGIVSLQLARTPRRAKTILHAWGAAGVAAARQNLRYDPVLIAGYVLALAGPLFYGAGVAERAGGRWLWWACVAVGCGAVLAGILDLVENWFLARTLDRSGPRDAATRRADGPSVGLLPDPLAADTAAAWFCSVAKFVLITVAIGWVFFAVVPSLILKAFSS